MSDAVARDQPSPAPWHDAPLQRIQSAYASGRLPHALLLHGAPGLGKGRFADWLARAALCDTPLEPFAPCNACPSCTLVAAGSHPDLLRIEPPEGKQNILIEQIREACERLALTSYRSGRKVALVEPAERMTIAAANSLLKTLEEPSADSLLLLVSSQPGSLPATIRSRCFRLGFAIPDRQVALDWLQRQGATQIAADALDFAGGAPYAALDLADGAYTDIDERMRRSLEALFADRVDAGTLASEWASQDPELRLQWLEFWCGAEIRRRIGGTAEQVTLATASSPLPMPSAPLNISGLYQLLDAVRELRRALTRTTLQKELAIESLLIRCLRDRGPAARTTGRR